MMNLTTLATGTPSPVWLKLYSAEILGVRQSDHTVNRNEAINAVIKLRELGRDARLRTDEYYLEDSSLS